MTLFINMRQASVSGGVSSHAYVIRARSATEIEGDAVPWAKVRQEVEGKRLLIYCHGFNVSMASAIDGAVIMEEHLNPRPDELFLAVLWPGDWFVKLVNYSFEYKDAVRAGRLLARFIDEHCGRASSVSMGSHSLGGRVVLEALATTASRIAQMCVAAAAVDADCLSKTFAASLSKVQRLTVLSSEKDNALRWAYPLGDFFSDVFGDDDSAFRGALGLGGPRPKAGPPVHADAIPPTDDYDHTHYFPGKRPPAGQAAKWARSTEYWGRAMRGHTPMQW